MTSHAWDLLRVQARSAEEDWVDWRCTMCGLSCSTLHPSGTEPVRPGNDPPGNECGPRRAAAVRAVMES